MKSTMLLLRTVLTGAVAVYSATWCQAATIVNFDAVDTSGGAVSGAPVTTYLSGFGITFSSVGGTAFILPYEPGNPFPVPVSSPNWFGVGGHGSGFNYLFVLQSSQLVELHGTRHRQYNDHGRMVSDRLFGRECATGSGREIPTSLSRIA